MRFLVGLDAGGAAFKAVVLAAGRGGPRLAGCDREPAPDAAGPEPDAAAAAAIRNLLARLEITPARLAGLATCIDTAHVALTTFEMPRMKPREQRQALPWEARKYLPDDDRAFDMRVQDRRLEDGGVRVLLASVPRPHLDRHRALLHAAGLSPEHIEPAPLALARACRRLRGEAPAETCLLLDIGRSGTTVVLGEDDGPFFCRFLDAGLGTPSADSPEPALVAEARAGCGELLEHLVLETRRSMAFFASQHAVAPVQRAVLAGGGAHYPDLVAALTEQLAIPVTPFGYAGNRAVPRIDAEYAVAYGLAARLAS